MVVTMALESDEAKLAVEAAEAAGGRLLLVPRLAHGYARVGTVAKVEDSGELPSGIRAVVVRGLERAVLGSAVPGPDHAGSSQALWVVAETAAAAPSASSERLHEMAREYRAVVQNILEQRGAGHLAEALRGISDPGQMADTAGYSADLSFEQKVQVLETIDVEARLKLVLGWATEVLADLSLKERIRTDVADGMERNQREFLLRQQLAAIRKELGDDAGAEGAIDDYRQRMAALDEAGTPLPQAAKDAVERELGRLERTPDQSPEHGWIRGWLDTVFELPWGVRTDDSGDAVGARAVLDADHTGIDDVKDRIVEYLAVRKLRAERGLPASSGRGSGAIVALVGPPGVGKTSLGESVARALGRKFARVSLGGVRDESEIRGHRRTYVGAQPGRIVRALREAGSMNPVFMLDEVDKLGSDWRGDPSSALLEVLDPAQNHTFRDHYLEVDLDLSDVLFVATANVIDTIPAPLLDRMEVIALDGYTTDEKVAIATDHLLARQIERNGLTPDEVSVTNAALHTIVSDYTREAGVRSLERQIAKVLRKVATRLASGEANAPVTVDSGDVVPFLGRRRFFFEAADRTAVPGVATGLAVTGVGGDVLFIEASALPSGGAGGGNGGEPGLTLTGQLGDVMKESATIALSYIRGHAAELGVTVADRFHLHVPAGAVPKDGPSAGITMVTALASLLTGRPVRSAVGMTGEVTLQGRVLPIGGVKQKVLAAHRAGLREILLPARNDADLDDVPEAVRQEMTFHLVSDVAEVLEIALEPTAAPVAPAAAAA
ncbi:MAG: endopeptidase La [Acidimicrobiales bacterium]